MPEEKVPVLEVMSREPITCPPGLTVDRAAAIMREEGIGSLVVTEGGRATGIVTERDIVTKVVAANKPPSSMKVKDIMTSPVISIHSHEDLEEAARTMNQRGIRRLPVVDDGKLVGMVTENDILRIWPHLVEVTRERARAGMLEAPDPTEGHCDSCGVYSTNLVRDGKILVCPDCR